MSERWLERMRVLGWLGLAIALLLTQFASQAVADPSRRVVWRIGYERMSAAEKSEAEAVVLRTLSRAEERHFASPELLRRKLEQEGLSIPVCFEDGSPCTRGGTFLTEVYNVDAYADAKFSKNGNEWQLNLALYRRLGGDATRIEMVHTQLERLVQSAIGSLFTLEASLNLSSQPPGAMVYLNGRLVGKTPIELKTVEGVQKLDFKLNGHNDASWEVNALKGEVYPYEAKLEALPTTFTMLTSTQNSTLWMDGQELGAANDAYEVLPGEHEFVVKAEGYEDFTQKIKIYPNHPQTAQAALLPKSEPWWRVRNRGIKRYRFSAYAGYQLLTTNMSLARSEADIYLDGYNESYSFSPQSVSANHYTMWASPVVHALVLGVTYEDEYWGAELFRLSLGGASMNRAFSAVYLGRDEGSSIMISPLLAERLTYISFYPLQFKLHYTFNIVQFEGVIGAGLTHLILHTKFFAMQPKFKQTAFSINFDLGVKYYLTEETYLKLSYVLQQDFEDSIDASRARHGFALTFGLSPYWLLRDDSPAPSAEPIHEVGYRLSNDGRL
ncbi:MAG: PEGA domain-containing protein [Bradymonadia bacterium]|jgi:hypothetical protein